MRFSASRMVLRAYDGQSRLEAARSARRWWPSLQPVRLALVVGTMNIDAESLLLATLAKSLVGLGYQVEVLAFSYGKAHDIWRTICRVNIVRIDKLKSVDWLKISRVSGSVGQHLRNYPESHLSIPNHIEDWRAHFNACTYVVFPDNHLPLLYSPLDTGNFLVISGSPVDIWAAKGYGTSHSQETLRKQHGIREEDVVVLVVGSYLFFDELPWDYAAVLRASAPHISWK